MKKITAAVLILAMLCTLPAACSSPQNSPAPDNPGNKITPEPDHPEKPGELNETIRKLFNDWYAYTVNCEYFYGDMLWSLSYLDSFFENQTWDSLQTARAALSLALRRAILTEPPENSKMTSADYDRLTGIGADVLPVQASFDSISFMKSDTLLDYQSYMDHLNSPGENLFQTFTLTTFKNWADTMRQIYELNLQICAVETDYLLLQVDGAEEETGLIEDIAENCPQINTRRGKYAQDPDALMGTMDDMANELERLIDTEMTKVIGQNQADLDLYKDIAAEYGDDFSAFVDAMASYVTDLKDFPTALPYPDWWYELDIEKFDDFLFTWEDEEGKMYSVLPGDDIETPPDRYSAEWSDVSMDEYLEYLEYLEQNGFPAGFASEKDGKHTVFFETETGSFSLKWEENTVSFLTMEGSVCFAPPWYVAYSRQVSSDTIGPEMVKPEARTGGGGWIHLSLQKNLLKKDNTIETTGARRS